MSTPARVVAVLCIAVGAYLAGTWSNRPAPKSSSAQSGRKLLYYACPMHPQYHAGRPGDCPSCGMRLEPVYAEGGEAGPRARSALLPPGAVEISPERLQIIGVKTEEVTKGPASYTVRVSGRVALDESRRVWVSTAVDGWVRSVAPITTGSVVQKDDLLATFYNRDFLTAQQSYFYALAVLDNAKKQQNADQLKLTDAQVRAAEENLEFLGMGETQRREVARTRQIARNIELRAPIAGLVLSRKVFPGLRFDRGTELFEITDISHVWVLADIFGDEARLMRPGQRARVILSAQGKSFPALFSDVLPMFNGSSRALQARLDVDNPGYALRPDMFVDVECPVSMPPAVNIPVDALIDSGRSKTVFVAEGDGRFQPRSVETGWRLGDRVEILSGLAPGDRIVASGTFLLDSESRMKQAAPDAQAQIDPVCGMQVDPRKGAGKSEYKGKTYYFCSEGCKKKFDGNPEVILGMKKG
jgi:Cu(I)/Ag(I) efflux system membrane fusion protein